MTLMTYSWGVPADVSYSSTVMTRLREARGNPQRGSRERRGDGGGFAQNWSLQARSQGLRVTWVGSVLLSLQTALEEGGIYSPVGSPSWSASASDGCTGHEGPREAGHCSVVLK